MHLLEGEAEVPAVLLGELGLVLGHIEIVVGLVGPGLSRALGAKLLARSHPRSGRELEGQCRFSVTC
jgi:hypothetical protein